MDKQKKTEFIRTLKYVCIAASAGVIQMGSNAILGLIWPKEVFPTGPVLFYLIGLVLSVVWNLTINRKFTFKAAGNMTKAVLLTIGFYVIFAPGSCLLQAWLVDGVLIEGWDFTLAYENCLHWYPLLGTALIMILNLGFEYPFQRFIVFRNSIDSAKKVEK